LRQHDDRLRHCFLETLGDGLRCDVLAPPHLRAKSASPVDSSERVRLLVQTQRNLPDPWAEPGQGQQHPPQHPLSDDGGQLKDTALEVDSQCPGSSIDQRFPSG